MGRVCRVGLAVSLGLVSAVTLSTSAPAGAIGAVSSAATTSSSCPALGLTTGIPTVGISSSSNGCVTIYPTSGDGHLPSGPNPPPGHLNAPIVGIAAAANWRGYWLAAADGGVFAFGDATFGGSLAATHFNAPVVGISVDPLTGGYRLVGADGGVFSFDAPFQGSAAGVHLDVPVIGMATDSETGATGWVRPTAACSRTAHRSTAATVCVGPVRSRVSRRSRTATGWSIGTGPSPSGLRRSGRPPTTSRPSPTWGIR